MNLKDTSEVMLFDMHGRCVGTAIPKSLTVNSLGDIEIECSHLDLPRPINSPLGDVIGSVSFCSYRSTMYHDAYNLAAKRSIEKVIFNDPATIVFWADGSKTVVKCQEHEVYDPEKGLAMAIAKRTFGNEGNYYNTFKKWLPEETKKESININPTEFARYINALARR